MSMVQQTPDGLLIVRTATQVYKDTASHAAADFGFSTPPLPAGCNDRVYDQGIRHAGTNGFTVLYGGPVPWVTGDNYIAGITAALAAQAARPPTPLPPPGTMMGVADAQHITQASPDNGSSQAQSSVRQKDGYTTVRGQGVQSSGQEDGNPTQKETQELKRRI